MEANKNTTQTATTPPAGGFDVAGLLSNPQIGEFIKHLLSAGGSALFSYMMSIKPMQDKMEALANENKDLKSRMEEMEGSHEELIIQLNKKFKMIQEPEEEEELQGTSEEYFSIKKKEKCVPANKRRKYLNS